MPAAQIRGSAAPVRATATARRWMAPASARVLRFAPLAPSTGPASLRRGGFGGLAAGNAYKPLTTMCMKADYTTPVDSVTTAKPTGGEIEEPAIVAPANEEINTEEVVVPQQKCAKIHDFCLGIPFGVAAAVAWKHCQAYATTKKLLPWGFYAALSAAMICFYSYVLLAGGNPPPKKAKVAA
nr:unnamed protein product [Digitaria exilis]